MNDFMCGGCDYNTEELKEGMSHAATTGHTLTRAVDEEGSTMTISLDAGSPDDDLHDGGDSYFRDEED